MFFKLYRRGAARGVVAAAGVVEHLDVVEDIGPCILPGWVDLLADSLALEQLEEALNHSNGMAIATPAHAADRVVVAQEPLPVRVSELTAPIRMDQHRLLGCLRHRVMSNALSTNSASMRLSMDLPMT